MLLLDVEEKITTVETNPDTFEKEVVVAERTDELLFVRGDGVILVSPPLRLH